MTHTDSLTSDDRTADSQHLADVLLAPPSNTSDETLAAALSAPPPSQRSMRLTRTLTTALVVVLAFVGGAWAAQQWGSGADQQAGSAAGRQGRAQEGFRAGGQYPGANAAAGATAGQAGAAAAGGQTGTAGGDGTDLATGSSAASAAAPTTGEVVLVDGDVIYVKDSSGNQLRVEVKANTTISTSHDTDLSDVKKGDTVTVTGTTSDSGLAATSVEVSK